MKRMMMLVLVMAVGLAGFVYGAADNVVASYFTNNLTVVSCTNAGTTGLLTNRNYVCFDIGEVTGLSTVYATNDVRVLIHSLLGYLYTRYTATTSTNRPALFTITEERAAYTGTLWSVEHKIKFYKAVDTWTYPTQ